MTFYILLVIRVFIITAVPFRRFSPARHASCCFSEKFTIKRIMPATTHRLHTDNYCVYKFFSNIIFKLL